jgi:hypothetical protein
VKTVAPRGGILGEEEEKPEVEAAAAEMRSPGKSCPFHFRIKQLPMEVWDNVDCRLHRKLEHCSVY